MARLRGGRNRLAVVMTAAMGIVLLQAAPASAHQISGPRPTNYRSRVVSISPRVRGISVRIVDLGNHLQLVNRTSSDVVVLGYGGEPYLRVGPHGVYRNENSPATYLNRTRYGTTPVPAFATTTSAEQHPKWQKVSDGNTARWHDHRTHWMSLEPPPEVQAEPTVFHPLGPFWQVVLLYQNTRIVVTGDLDWIPGPSGRPWVPLIALCFVLGVVAALPRRSYLLLCAALVVLIGVDAFHTIAAEMFRPGTTLTKTIQFFGDNFVSVIVWVAAVPTVKGLRRRTPDALYGTLFVAALIGLVGGAVDLSYLWKSQLPTVGPHILQRACVAVLFGLGTGIATLTLGRVITLTRTRPTAEPVQNDAGLPLAVGGLTDGEITRIVGQLDADEVIGAALADGAARIAPTDAALFDRGVGFVILADDDVGAHRWIVEHRDDTVRVASADTSGQAELRTTLPTFLKLVAGTVTLDDTIRTGRATLAGDTRLVHDAARWFFGTAAPLPDASPAARSEPGTTTPISSQPNDRALR